MKKIEKLKLNEMQDFTAIQKDESKTLKGGVWASTEEGWGDFMYSSHYEYEYDSVCGSGTRYLRDGREFWTEYRVGWYEGSQYRTGQFLLGSHWTSGYEKYYSVDSPTSGTNWETFWGSTFGDWDNVQSF